MIYNSKYIPWLISVLTLIVNFFNQIIIVRYFGSSISYSDFIINISLANLFIFFAAPIKETILIDNSESGDIVNNLIYKLRENKKKVLFAFLFYFLISTFEFSSLPSGTSANGKLGNDDKMSSSSFFTNDKSELIFSISIDISFDFLNNFSLNP